MSVRAAPDARLALREVFWIFLKAGLVFGGGLAILAVFEDELVEKRGLVRRDEFLAMYGISKLVPSGTMTALAVAFGYRFAGFPGSAVALAGLVLPALVSTVVLTAMYGYLRNGPLLAYLPVTVLPAALVLILLAAARMARDIRVPSPELWLAAAAFVGLLVFHINPALLLVAGGAVGAVIFGRGSEPPQ